MALEQATGLGDPLLSVIIVVSAFVSVPLVLLGILAYRRRRTVPYLFVASAFVAFLFKSIVGIGSLIGVVSIRSHHLLEHGLDIIVVVLLIAAVYVERGTNRVEELPFEESP